MINFNPVTIFQIKNPINWKQFFPKFFASASQKEYMQHGHPEQNQSGTASLRLFSINPSFQSPSEVILSFIVIFGLWSQFGFERNFVLKKILYRSLKKSFLILISS